MLFKTKKDINKYFKKNQRIVQFSGPYALNNKLIFIEECTSNHIKFYMQISGIHAKRNQRFYSSIKYEDLNPYLVEMMVKRVEKEKRREW